MGADSAAVFLSTLNGTSPALSMAGTGGNGGNSLVVDLGDLSVVSARVIKLVYMNLLVGLDTILRF